MTSAQPVAEEAEDLRQLANRLAAQAPWVADACSALLKKLDADLAAATTPPQAERATETFTHDLRAAWLRACANISADVYRTPTASEEARLKASPHESFGYERDFHPEKLERRCDAFFAAPPPGWRQRHIIFDSGQAATTSTLLALAGEGRKTLAHIGCYFETGWLVDALPALIARVDHDPDIALIEPISCNGQFRTDTAERVSRLGKAGVALIDSTLDGALGDPVPVAEPLRPHTVIRLSSGLKLLQQGFELANVGIVTITARDPDKLAARLMQLRTLSGASLVYTAALALEAPWFLNRADTERYEAAIFAHNGALAHALAESNTRFAPITHPALEGSAAPYVTLQLPSADVAAYDRLEAEIGAEASARGLLFEKGGSFGFRGHRYEVVRPEAAPPFLRIAMGRRSGWSCDGIIAMMAEIASRP